MSQYAVVQVNGAKVADDSSEVQQWLTNTSGSLMLTILPSFNPAMSDVKQVCLNRDYIIMKHGLRRLTIIILHTFKTLVYSIIIVLLVEQLLYDNFVRYKFKQTIK